MWNIYESSWNIKQYWILYLINWPNEQDEKFKFNTRNLDFFFKHIHLIIFQYLLQFVDAK